MMVMMPAGGGTHTAYMYVILFFSVTCKLRYTIFAFRNVLWAVLWQPEPPKPSSPPGPSQRTSLGRYLSALSTLE